MSTDAETKALVRQLVAQGETQGEIAVRFGRSRGWVQGIIHPREKSGKPPGRPKAAEPRILPYNRGPGRKKCPQCSVKCYLPLPKKRPDGVRFQPLCIACQVRAAILEGGYD